MLKRERESYTWQSFIYFAMQNASMYGPLKKKKKKKKNNILPVRWADVSSDIFSYNLVW